MAEETEDKEKTRPTFKNGVYSNPWETWTRLPSFYSALWGFTFKWTDYSKIPNSKTLDETLPVQSPDFSKLRDPPSSGVQAMWIGHASMLVQFDGISVLTDPVFSDRCSPSQYFGPKRYRPPPCKIEDLPKVDAVVISHNHYDHLDVGSVKELNRKFEDHIWWHVPVGTKQWMLNKGCKNVVELTWWQEHKHVPNEDITFVLTPSQHWCKRTAFDTNKALWGSWVVKGPKHRFFFGGDTGYCNGFKQIGREYGPFSLSAIPIGAYCPRHFMLNQHVNPEEAVQIHQDVKSQKSIGIHWGTFKLTYEFYLEPPEKLAEAVEKAGLQSDSFITIGHGETKSF